MSSALPPSKAEAVVSAVCAIHEVAPTDLLGPARFSAVNRARQHAMWLLRGQGYSSPQVGAALGRDHTTVLHGARAHAKRVAAAEAVKPFNPVNAVTTPSPQCSETAA